MNTNKTARLLVLSSLSLLAIGWFSISAAAPVVLDPDLPSYEPRPFTVPKDAGYLRPDGSIFIAGAGASKKATDSLTALFTKTHPGTRFTTQMPGSSVGPASILFNLSPFAVMNREMIPAEIVPFEYMYQRQPMGIRIGRGSYEKPDYSTPAAFWVNKKNPLERLTVEQVARIFTAGGGKGDITTWGQLGLTGEWARRSIRVMGPLPTTGVAICMRVYEFGNFPYVERYEGMKSADIGRRVSEDVAALGMADLSHRPTEPDVKIVAIGETADGYFSRASYEDVLAGRYPFTRYLYYFLNRDPKQPLDPFVKEYLRMVLSKEGQQALCSEPNGFLPLSAKEVYAELKKLE
ncbi:MAG: substrate-binding domain-containing protein [Opitutaceae bacterium]|nr:substrate-binding domain-containing protein [Opitutaceae bacterium]